MYTMLLLIVLCIAYVAIFNKSISKNKNWPDTWANIAIAFMITLLCTLLASISFTTPSVTEYPLVKVNNSYFTTSSSDKYGTIFYNYAFQTGSHVISKATTHFYLTDSYKVVIVKQNTILGNWGFQLLNNADEEYRVHIPKNNSLFTADN